MLTKKEQQQHRCLPPRQTPSTSLTVDVVKDIISKQLSTSLPALLSSERAVDNASTQRLIASSEFQASFAAATAKANAQQHQLQQTAFLLQGQLDSKVHEAEKAELKARLDLSADLYEKRDLARAAHIKDLQDHRADMKEVHRAHVDDWKEMLQFSSTVVTEKFASKVLSCVNVQAAGTWSQQPEEPIFRRSQHQRTLQFPVPPLRVATRSPNLEWCLPARNPPTPTSSRLPRWSG